MDKLFNDGLNTLMAAKKKQVILHSFFEYQDVKRLVREEMRSEGLDPDAKENAGKLLCRCVKRMELTIPAGSSSGRKFRQRGKGLGSGANRGDLLARVMIKAPASLGDEERQLWEKLAQTSSFSARV